MRRLPPCLALGFLLTMSGCGQDPAAPASVDTSAAHAPAAATLAAPAGKTVVLDPGHNGGNGANPKIINSPVSEGSRDGEPRNCNTAGTTTNDGFPEHTFNYEVAMRVADQLRAKGVNIVMTRNDDQGVGPCLDDRARIGNAAEADAVVSIHADGSESSEGRGFHVSYSAPPLNEAQGEPSIRLARSVHEGLRGTGITVTDYVGKGSGLAPRDDLIGLNLTERPTVLVECGNMRNSEDAAAMTSPDGRAKYAEGIATGILEYVS